VVIIREAVSIAIIMTIGILLTSIKMMTLHITSAEMSALTDMKGDNSTKLTSKKIKRLQLIMFSMMMRSITKVPLVVPLAHMIAELLEEVLGKEEVENLTMMILAMIKDLDPSAINIERMMIISKVVKEEKPGKTENLPRRKLQKILKKR